MSLQARGPKKKASGEKASPSPKDAEKSPSPRTSPSGRNIQEFSQSIVEIVSDSGEGSQTAGQIFGTLGARMGNGVWTVEIIPAEIEPPARSPAGASGNRIRMGTEAITNMGDTADVVVAFNEQVLYSRIDVGAFREGTHLFIECKWAEDPQEEVRQAYAKAMADFAERGYLVHEVPMEQDCLNHVSDARRGKNIWVLGFLCSLYCRDIRIASEEVTRKFARKGRKVVESNLSLLQAGYEWAEENLDFQFRVPIKPVDEPQVVMNGNTAVGLGAMAAGFEICSMYPITPATSASHYLAGVFNQVGGIVHQAEDEIAAIGFALGASYAGKTALTITSGPGLALKTEFIGLAVMAEIPLVIVNVQRGGPSTGLPTRVEQSDLLAALYASPGDTPKIVLAPSTIAECFDFMVTARRLAEAFRGVVIVLTDANLASGVQPFPKPKVNEDWLSPPIDQSDWDTSVEPYDWDVETGISQRPIPGQKGGEFVLTGLAHDESSRIAYTSDVNQRSSTRRSRKLETLRQTLKPPEIFGESEGDLLVVGWGSTRGAIEEAVERVAGDGGKASSIHLRFLSPLEPGLKEIFSRFRKVMTVEINYSDEDENPHDQSGSARMAQLALYLRSHTLVEIGFWSRVPGVSLSPGDIENELRKRLKLK